MSSNERLKKYVRENDIVDIELNKSGLAAAFDDDDEDDEWTHPPVELDNAAFPILQDLLIQMKTMLTRLLMFMMLSKLMHRKTRLLLTEKHRHLQTSQLRR